MEPVGTTYQSARTDRPVRMMAAIRTSWRTSLRRAARFSGVKAMTRRSSHKACRPLPSRYPRSMARYTERHAASGVTPRAAEARDLAFAVSLRLRDRHHDPRVHVDLPEDGPSRLRHADRDVRSRPPLRGAEVPQGIRERLPEPRHLQRERREPRPRRSRSRASAAPDGRAGRLHAAWRPPDDGRGALPARGNGRRGCAGCHFAAAFAAAPPGRVVPSLRSRR